MDRAHPTQPSEKILIPEKSSEPQGKVVWKEHAITQYMGGKLIKGGRTEETIKAIQQIIKPGELSLSELRVSKEKITEIKKRVSGHIKKKYPPILNLILEFRATSYLRKILRDINQEIKGLELNPNNIDKTHIESLCARVDKDSVNDEISQGKTLLHYAIELGDSNSVKKLLEKGARLESSSKLTTIKELCENIDKESVNLKISGGKTLLHYAIDLGDEASVNKLLEKEAAILPDEKGNTPLHYAVEKNYSDIANILIGKEKTSELRKTNSNGEEPFMQALRKGIQNLSICKAIVTKLSTESNQLVKFTDKEGNTPWHLLARAGTQLNESEFSEWKQLLLSVSDKSKNPWLVPNKNGRTPLDFAALRGTPEIIAKIIADISEACDPFKDINLSGEEIKTVSMVFQRNENLKCEYPVMSYIVDNPEQIKSLIKFHQDAVNTSVQELNEKIKDPSQAYETLYEKVVPPCNREPTLKDSEISTKKNEAPDEKGNNYWHKLASGEVTSTSRALPEWLFPGTCGDKLAEKNKEGLTPLHVAIQHGNVAFFDALCGPGTKYDNSIKDWKPFEIDGQPLLHYVVRTYDNIKKKEIKDQDDRTKLDNLIAIAKRLTAVAPTLVFEKDKDGHNLKQLCENLKDWKAKIYHPDFNNIDEDPGKYVVDRRLETQDLLDIQTKCQATLEQYKKD